VCAVSTVLAAACVTHANWAFCLKARGPLLLYAPLLPRVRRCVIRDQLGQKTKFKIRRDLRLGKVFNAYCKRHGVELGLLRFMIDGKRLQDDDTPLKLNINEGDEIEVVQEQIGGC
jgi:hypothetical protein